MKTNHIRSLDQPTRFSSLLAAILLTTLCTLLAYRQTDGIEPHHIKHTKGYTSIVRVTQNDSQVVLFGPITSGSCNGTSSDEIDRKKR